MFKITLSNSVVFECSAEQTILDAALSRGIVLEHSCKSGRCGACIAGVLEGETNLELIESYNEKKSDVNSGILTCCRSPNSDIRLDLEDLGDIGLIKARTLPCRVNAIELLTDEVCCLQLRMPPSTNFQFVPGQYVDLIKGDIRRSYSIANAQRQDGTIHLQIKKITAGKMSDYLFNQACKNDLLRLEGPLGTFSYRNDTSENIVLLATGTGIAPIKALLEGFEHELPNKNIYVLWGGRYRDDLYMNFKNLDLDFVYIPVLSREKVDGYLFGYVQNVVLDLGIDLVGTTVYACGSVAMIDSALQLLTQNGLQRKNFHSDAFVSSN